MLRANCTRSQLISSLRRHEIWKTESRTRIPLRGYALHEASHADLTCSVRPSAPLVQVWWAKTADVPWHEATASYESLLPDEELVGIKQAAEGSALRKERLLARVLVRTSLASSLGLGTAAKDLTFRRNIHGKPLLQRGSPSTDGPPALHYNLTHTTGLVGCSVSSSCSVGVDAELLSRRPAQLLKLARRRLSDIEYASLAAVTSDEERAVLFMRLWTLKEAFVKCRGVGINTPPGLKGFSLGFQRRPVLLEATLSSLCGLPLGGSQPVEITLALNGDYAESALLPGLGRSQGRSRHQDLDRQSTVMAVGSLLPYKWTQGRGLDNSGNSGADDGKDEGYRAVSSRRKDSGSSQGGNGSSFDDSHPPPTKSSSSNGGPINSLGSNDDRSGGDRSYDNRGMASQFKFMLMQPSCDHVAAICLHEPPIWLEGDSGRSLDLRDSGDLGRQNSGISKAEGYLNRKREELVFEMRQCVPLMWERRLLLGQGTPEGVGRVLGYSD